MKKKSRKEYFSVIYLSRGASIGRFNQVSRGNVTVNLIRVLIEVLRCSAVGSWIWKRRSRRIKRNRRMFPLHLLAKDHYLVFFLHGFYWTDHKSTFLSARNLTVLIYNSFFFFHLLSSSFFIRTQWSLCSSHQS